MGEIIPFPMRKAEELPNRIRLLRQEKGMKLKELAFQVGCSESQMSDLEIGERRLSDVWMRKIAPALGVAERDLLWAGSGTPNKFDRLQSLFEQASEEQQDALMRVAETMISYTPPPARKNGNNDH